MYYFHKINHFFSHIVKSKTQIEVIYIGIHLQSHPIKEIHPYCLKSFHLIMFKIILITIDFQSIIAQPLNNGKLHQWCAAEFVSIPAIILLFGKSLKSQPNLNGFVFSKRTPKYLSFALVIKHSPHFQLQYQEGPNLDAQIAIVHCAVLTTASLSSTQYSLNSSSCHSSQILTDHSLNEQDSRVEIQGRFQIGRRQG